MEKELDIKEWLDKQVSYSELEAADPFFGEYDIDEDMELYAAAGIW